MVESFSQHVVCDGPLYSYNKSLWSTHFGTRMLSCAKESVILWSCAKCSFQSQYVCNSLLPKELANPDRSKREELLSLPPLTDDLLGKITQSRGSEAPSTHKKKQNPRSGHMTQASQSEYTTCLAMVIVSEMDTWSKQNQSELSLEFSGKRILNSGANLYTICLKNDAITWKRRCKLEFKVNYSSSRYFSLLVFLENS